MTLLLDRDGRTATITINRPPLNILDIPTIQRLGDVLSELEDMQLVVIRGAGDRAFSAGVAVQDHTPDLVGPMLESLHGAIRKLRDLSAVTVAAVKGHCLGGGMELALACDLVIATEDARFGQPEIELGCYPPVAAALYPSLIGPGQTLDLLLTGRTLTCEEAERMGLIARRVPSLDEGLAKLTAEILAKSAAVVRLTKKAVRAGRDHGFSEALAESERLYLDELCPTADMAEGIAAFLEKRQPVWKHR
ncbi:MAG: cyclohexa,5-dienecarbonyl-CoA hydratase [Acidobacteriota bacterium]|jgi:cyclohexa-1,5-dienecarbonyl-CoA hydratase|nr:cyclohexa,5-dienecarbonyl-CoA hydratase [Acidobacteriota bacterium]